MHAVGTPESWQSVNTQHRILQNSPCSLLLVIRHLIRNQIMLWSVNPWECKNPHSKIRCMGVGEWWPYRASCELPRPVIMQFEIRAILNRPSKETLQAWDPNISKHHQLKEEGFLRVRSYDRRAEAFTRCPMSSEFSVSQAASHKHRAKEYRRSEKEGPHQLCCRPRNFSLSMSPIPIRS